MDPREAYLRHVSKPRRADIARRLGVSLTDKSLQRRGEPRRRRRLTADELLEEILAAHTTESAILRCLRQDELRRIAGSVDVPVGKATNKSLLAAIEGELRRRGCVRLEDDYPEQYDEFVELREWADAFCAQATAAGEAIDFNCEPWEAPAGESATSTLRLMAAVWPMSEDPCLLDCTSYCTKGSKVALWAITISDEISTYYGGRICIRGPEFPYYHLLIGPSCMELEFDLTPVPSRKMLIREHKMFADAIRFNLLDEYDDQFILCCSGKTDRLWVCMAMADYGASLENEGFKPGRINWV